MTATKDPKPTASASRARVITLGCRLNSYESEVMRGHADAAGLDDAIIVNTCAVTSEAVRSARQTIRRAKKDNPDARILVTGCAAQINPDEFAAMPEVDRVIGNHEKMQADTWVLPALNEGREKILVNDIMSVKETAAHLIDGMEGRARAYVQVQNGCDHRCTFCIIPYGRGNSRSVPAGDVVQMVRRLVETGHYEVVLTGVDLTSWGADLPGQPQLGNLVQRILKLVPELQQLRISSIDAIEMDDALFEAIGDPRLAPFMHLSLQHGDNLMLKRMKRRHSREDAIELAQKLRAIRPDIALGADIIAGFPTETESAFENSVRLVEDCNLAFLHVFPYSPRPGTPAARMPQLEKALIKERAARLREVGERALSRHLDTHVGAVRDVLVEQENDGRLSDFSRVALTGFATLEAGRPVPARIVAQDGQKLIAEPA
jgi:threonylcarbamoyladenosine tRNA methylthiotransferase MtaB